VKVFSSICALVLVKTYGNPSVSLAMKILEVVHLTLDNYRKLSQSLHLFHGFWHNLWPRFLGKDLEHGDKGIGESAKLVQSFEEAKQLHGNAGSDDEQAHCEDDQTAQFASWTKDFVHEIFKHWRSFDQSNYTKNLQNFLMF